MSGPEEFWLWVGFLVDDLGEGGGDIYYYFVR